jgi:hypothetical protein
LKNINFGFFLKPLSVSELVFISLILFMESFVYYFKSKNIHLESVKIIDSIIFMILWWIPITTPLSEKLRNIYITSFWIIICAFWFLIKEDFITSILPIVIFIFTQVARLIFKWIFKIEPIPLFAYRYEIHRHSKIENRKSNSKDFHFTLIVFALGAFLSIVISNI